MKKQIALALLAAALVLPVASNANEATKNSAAAQGSAAQTSAQAEQDLELKDGTKVKIKGNEVWVIGKDGAATAAPDGTHTTKDGKTITTKGGKLAN